MGQGIGVGVGEEGGFKDLSLGIWRVFLRDI